MPIYQPGDTIELTTEFRDPDTEALVDPTDVTLEVVDPTGVTTTYPAAQITRVSLGLYLREIVAAIAGMYRYRWTGTGSAAGVDEGEFTVQPSLLSAPLLCSVEDVRQLLDVARENTTQDDLISVEIARASKLIEKVAQREFAPRGTLTRTFRMEDGYLDLNPRDLQSATLVTIAAPGGTPDTLTADDGYVLGPEGGSDEGTFFAIELGSSHRRLTSAFGFARVAITGAWGMAAVPKDVENACAQTVALWLRRDVQAFTSTYNVDEGRLERPEALPSQVAAVVGNYTRWGV